MNTRMIGFVLGRILLTEAGLLVLPTITAALYGEILWPWIASIILTAACGGALSSRKPERTALYAKDGFVTVALAWLAMSAFGALPFVLNGDISHYVDAFFETVSGFTTTGASILTAVEPLSRGSLFWRSFTHWVGGMGVLVFVMAILPMSDGHSMHILRAEMPGPTAGKLVSRMSDTAKILYSIYLAMTVVMIALLLLGGMDLFDACVHAFGTAGTGGFSSRNLSIGAYNSAYIDIVRRKFPQETSRLRQRNHGTGFRQLVEAFSRTVVGFLPSNRIRRPTATRLREGKNATDIALTIDAMELAFDRNVEGFVLISADSDFTPLAVRLRELGFVVIGAGRAGAPSLEAACTRYHHLEGEPVVCADSPGPAPGRIADASTISTVPPENQATQKWCMERTEEIARQLNARKAVDFQRLTLGSDNIRKLAYHKVLGELWAHCRMDG